MKPVVLIHGANAGGWMWERVTPLLDAGEWHGWRQTCQASRARHLAWDTLTTVAPSKPCWTRFRATSQLSSSVTPEAGS